MGVKLVKKKNLEFHDGYMMYKGDVVMLDSIVVRQINELEEYYQKFKYLRDQPKAQPEPTLDGFKFKSTIAKPHFEVETPVLDDAIKKAMTIMAEIDANDTAKEVNEAFEYFGDLIQWVKAKKVFVDPKPTYPPYRIDTNELGNPLEWDADGIIDIIVAIATLGEVTR